MNRKLRRLMARAFKMAANGGIPPWETVRYRYVQRQHMRRRGNWIARQTTY